MLMFQVHSLGIEENCWAAHQICIPLP